MTFGNDVARAMLTLSVLALLAAACSTAGISEEGYQSSGGLPAFLYFYTEG